MLFVMMKLYLAVAVSEECGTTSRFLPQQLAFATVFLATLLAAIVTGMVATWAVSKVGTRNSISRRKEQRQTTPTLAILTRGGTVAAFLAMIIDGRGRKWRRKWKHRMKCWARKQPGNRTRRCHQRTLAAINTIITKSRRSRSLSLAVSCGCRLGKMASRGYCIVCQSVCRLINGSWRKTLSYAPTTCFARLGLWSPVYSGVVWLRHPTLALTVMF